MSKNQSCYAKVLLTNLADITTDVYSLAGQNIPIIKSARRKSIAVKRIQQEVVIEVPKGISKLRLKATLDKHQSWLLKQIDKQQQIKQQKFLGLAGERFEYLGESYHCYWSDEPPVNARKLSDYEVNHDLNTFRMYFKNGLSQSKKQQLTFKALQAFYNEQAQSYIASKLHEYAEVMQLTYKNLTIKTYKSRWGSCYPDGRIQFNWRLMQAPAWVVDYVVVHELAHLRHANHSAAFWQLVDAFYPQTPEAKQQLKIHGHRWIEFLNPQ